MSDRSTPLSDVPNDSSQEATDVKMESSTDTPVADIKTEAQTTPETEGTPAESEAPVTPGSTKRSAVDDADGESPVKKTKGKASPKGPVTPGRQRKAPVKAPISGRAIATSMDELSSEDRLLLNMKDQGKSWKEIGEAWQAATGIAPAKSTLPNRYARLRANITTMSEADQRHLVAAKAAVEAEFEVSKWERIAQKMQELGSAEKFSSNVLQKQLAKMQVSQVARPAEDPLDEVAE